ncbi:MAG TPA: hypothetical protein PLM08_25000 [Polyangiaceae bacterium]|nr:hypothetical protein [Polyangiaceae bacterium]
MKRAGDSGRYGCCIRWSLWVAAWCAGMTAWLGGIHPADAQIKQPGTHLRYGVEVEPHLLFMHDGHSWYGDDDGWGPGVRLSVPIIEDGPINTINNSLAIGFGLDWAHFKGHCWSPAWRVRPSPNDPYYHYWYEKCSANEIWVPVVLQWNFFFTDFVSAMAELGPSIVRRSWEYYVPCPGGWCKDTEADLDLEPLIFHAGVRLHFSQSVGMTIRLGWPYLLAGASLFF